MRILEDNGYQASVRNSLVSYVQSAGDSVSRLSSDLAFYEKFSFKLLSERARNLARVFGSPLSLSSVYYPWNRTFEIGFTVKRGTKDFVQFDSSSRVNGNTVNCNVVVVGGSTAALAAALSAADEEPAARVCLLEPTSTAGGQMTVGLISAIDFGRKNRKASCLPKTFVNEFLGKGGFVQG